MSEGEGHMSDVLQGIRVLDFGRYIAGPYCAALLADLGADVIRVERRGGGEDRWVAPVAPDGAGAMFLTMNRNKRAMTLDPACSEGPGDRQEARRDLRRRRGQPAARRAALARARSGQPASGEAGHHPHHRHRVRRRRPLEPQARLRRRGPADVRVDLPERHAGPADPRIRRLGRLRDGVAGGARAPWLRSWRARRPAAARRWRARSSAPRSPSTTPRSWSSRSSRSTAWPR